jgi:hypothetical protein
VTVSFFNELDTGKELCSRPLFHFLTSFPQRRKTMLVSPQRRKTMLYVSFFNELSGFKTMLKIFVSFFNELATEKKNYAHGSGFNPQIFVSFFNELATERKLKTMLIF